MAILAVLFLVVPFVEIAVLVAVAGQVGVVPTLALVVAVSVAGAWLVEREGLGVWRRAQDQLGRGEVPAAGLVDGLLILFAGALMLTPGFVTDAIGLLLLVPPTRALVRVVLMRRYERRLRAAFVVPGAAWATAGGETGFGPRSRRVATGPATYRREPVIDVHEAGGDAAAPEG